MKSLKLFTKLLAITTVCTILNLYLKVNLFIVIQQTVGIPSDTSQYVLDTSSLRESGLHLGFIYLLYLAFLEELIFRGPIGLSLLFKKTRKLWPLVAIITSVIFGLAHGGWANIFLQGIGGIIYCVVFVMVSNNNDENGFIKGLATTTTFHALFNLLVVYYL